MNRAKVVATLAMAVMVLATVSAEEPKVDWDLCPLDERMRVLVEKLPDRMKRGGLTEERIHDAVEKRLRSANIYDIKAEPYLYVRMESTEPASGIRSFAFFVVDVQYLRRLAHVPRSGWTRLYTVWSKGSTGAGTPEWVMETLEGIVDKFMLEYLRVRDTEECQSLRQQER